MKTALCLFSLAAASLTAQTWSPQAAAGYLDGRLQWWSTWSGAQRDHDTFCISCHTVLPYALGRPALRSALGETAPSSPEAALLANLTKRVRLWQEVAPFYPDATRGAGKTRESRGTEAILNALALLALHAPLADTTLALDNMLGEQLTSGDAAGAWPWLQFHNAPWEGDSQFMGATLAALALGRAPAAYQAKPTVQPVLGNLRRYLAAQRPHQTLLDRLLLAWAANSLSGLLTREERLATLHEAVSKQQDDGGFSLSQFIGAWTRKDDTPLETRSDGYATGVVALVMRESGMSASAEPLRRTLAWLSRNQDSAEGRWPAWSLNKNRELNSDAGRFMSDAATAFAVMALSGEKQAPPVTYLQHPGK